MDLVVRLGYQRGLRRYYYYCYEASTHTTRCGIMRPEQILLHALDAVNHHVKDRSVLERRTGSSSLSLSLDLV